MTWTPELVIALLGVMGTLIVNLSVGIAGVIIAIKTGQKVDGMLKDRDAANVTKGERKGEEAGRTVATALAEGQRQGRENALAMLPVHAEGKPLPVVDEEAASIAARTAKATEDIAEAQTRTATAAERKS